MRKLIMLSVAVLIAACSDNQQPTSPINGSGPHAGSASELSQSAQANAKPQSGPVGFTKVAQYVGTWITVLPGALGGTTVECPSGWTAIAGGHEFGGLNTATQPVIVQSTRLELPTTTGWYILVSNQQAGAASVELLPYVVCAS